MTRTLIQQLADFSTGTTYDSLPANVVHESKRILLDSIGCAVGAIDELKGRAGIEYGRIMGGGQNQATIMGTGDKVSLFGAAYANAELINTLDMDAVLPPGHVSPYVLPGAVAMAEAIGSSGKSLIAALAVAHEMSNRMGKAMDYLRDTKDGKVNPPKVFGYASTIFGATAAIGMLRGLSNPVLANALGVAGYISPVNSQVTWFQHAPNSTIKYLMAGVLAQQALTASYAGELGHRGDVRVLDNRDVGYARFIGTSRWEPDRIVDALGTEWRFPGESSIKPYPHCRIMHATFDCITRAVRANGLKPEEMESIKVYIEGFAEQPCWTNRNIELMHDAQFSMAHGVAMAAHLVPLGKEWQDPAIVRSESVMSLMDRVETQVHPDYVKLLTSNAASRPAHVEIRARGQTFIEEQRYPKGSPSPDPSSYMTDEELIEKFRHNCQGTLPAAQVDAVIDSVMTLETLDNVSPVFSLTGRPASERAAAKVELAPAK